MRLDLKEVKMKKLLLGLLVLGSLSGFANEEVGKFEYRKVLQEGTVVLRNSQLTKEGVLNALLSKAKEICSEVSADAKTKSTDSYVGRSYRYSNRVAIKYSTMDFNCYIEEKL